jgi:hypothetical protein
MAASSRLMIAEAERRFPARIKIAMPPEGLGRQLTDMMAWLDANCGAGNWAIAPAGLRGIVNNAVAIYFLDTALANAFVARWCIGYRTAVNGNFRVCEDAPPPHPRQAARVSGPTDRAVAEI